MGKSLHGIVLISILWALFAPTESLAQRSTFQQYGQAEGLSNLNVNVLFQNRAGVLWAGTENGLFRYDGLRFERVSLGSDNLDGDVLALHEDSAGRLWVGRQNGVGYLQDGAFQIVHFQDRKLGLFAGSTIASLPDGTVFIASDGNLLAGNESDSPGQWNFHQFASVRLKVHSVLAAPDGSLLLACGSGICRLKGSELRTWGPTEGVEEDNFQSLFLSSRGDLWALGSKHIVTLSKGASTFQKRSVPEMLNPDSLNTIAEDPQGRVLTSNGKQVLRWENGAWRIFE
jgi:ligand-binding sensor domain-containing protein